MYLNLHFSSSLSPSSPSSSSFSPGFRLSKASLGLLIQPLKCWACWCEPPCLADCTVHPSNNARLGWSRLRGEFRLSSVIWDGLLHWAPAVWMMMSYFTEPLLFGWWLHWHQKRGISLSASSCSPLSNHPQHQATPHQCSPPPPYSPCLSSSLDPFILGGLGSPQLFCRGFQFHFLGPFYKLGCGSPWQNQTRRRVSKSKPRFCTWEKNIFLNRQ